MEFVPLDSIVSAGRPLWTFSPLALIRYLCIDPGLLKPNRFRYQYRFMNHFSEIRSAIPVIDSAILYLALLLYNPQGCPRKDNHRCFQSATTVLLVRGLTRYQSYHLLTQDEGPQSEPDEYRRMSIRYVYAECLRQVNIQSINFTWEEKAFGLTTGIQL